jgi:hypothetical protein
MGPELGLGSLHRHGQTAIAGAHHHHREVAPLLLSGSHQTDGQGRQAHRPYPGQARNGPDLGLEAHTAMPHLDLIILAHPVVAGTAATQILTVAHRNSAEPLDRDRPIGNLLVRGGERGEGAPVAHGRGGG